MTRIRVFTTGLYTYGDMMKLESVILAKRRSFKVRDDCWRYQE